MTPNHNILIGFGCLIFCGVGPLAQTIAPTTDLPVVAAAASTPTPAPTHAGFVKSVRGAVQLRSVDGSLRAARSGDPMAATDQVVTDAASAASIVLRDGTALMVGPSSQFELKTFHFDATTQDGSVLVSLLRGSLRMITGLIGRTHPEAVRVDTQTATIGIRGTDFIVRAGDDL